LRADLFDTPGSIDQKGGSDQGEFSEFTIYDLRFTPSIYDLRFTIYAARGRRTAGCATGGAGRHGDYLSKDAKGIFNPQARPEVFIRRWRRFPQIWG
jgi:hypothetical protein